MLLAKGADINMQGKDGSVLQGASGSSHEKTVQLLLANGADVNMYGGEYAGALQVASLGDHEKGEVQVVAFVGKEG